MQIERLPVLAEAKRPEVAGQAALVQKSGKPEAKVTSLDAARVKEQQNREEAKPTDADVDGAIQRLSDYVQSAKRDLLFSVDKDTGRTVIQVLDSETKDVIRQIPPDEILALARRLQDTDQEPGGLLKLRV
jgi:flagellar protein FlaG